MEGELEKAREAKTVAEAECEARVTPIEVALHCLAIRERRREGDLVKDDLEVGRGLAEQCLTIACVNV